MMFMRAENIFLKKMPVLTICTGIAVLIAAYLLQPEAEVPMQNEAVDNKKVEETRFGPGKLSGSKHAMPLYSNQSAIDNEVPFGLAVTPGQQLLPNKELRKVFDYFLARSNSAGRAGNFAKLDTHLKTALPTPAYLEARQIASDYMNYLNAYDEMMAHGQNQPKNETTSVPVDSVEMERFSITLSQISRMRQSMLGVRIAQLWYADEEEDMQQNFVAVRQRNIDSQ
jgi:hypothetical protein